jgi:flavodoxin I
MTIGIYFGSTTGNTGDLAQMIFEQLGDLASEPVDIESLTPSDLLGHDTILLGIPTWNVGQLQKDWEEFGPQLAGHDLSGKVIGLFGCGDQAGYPDTFGDAFGLLWDMLEPRGAKLIGRWPTDGYQFDGSLGVRDGMFLGLLCDPENQPELTKDRVTGWTRRIREELGR